MSPTVPPISVITTSWFGRQPPDGALDGVGDVRDHLHRRPQVVAAALLGDHVLVDPPGGDVVRLRERLVDEALVVPRSRSVSAPSSVTKTSPCWKGESVPGSTLMYGSNFWIVTRSPRSTRSRPSEAAAIPLPREETTPPVTKMYLVGRRVRFASSGVRSPGPRRVTQAPFGPLARRRACPPRPPPRPPAPRRCGCPRRAAGAAPAAPAAPARPSGSATQRAQRLARGRRRGPRGAGRPRRPAPSGVGSRVAQPRDGGAREVERARRRPRVTTFTTAGLRHSSREAIGVATVPTSHPPSCTSSQRRRQVLRPHERLVALHVHDARELAGTSAAPPPPPPGPSRRGARRR